MLIQLEHADKVAGVKQTRRALQDGRAKELFLARDADPGLTEPLARSQSNGWIPCGSWAGPAASPWGPLWPPPSDFFGFSE